MKETDDEDVLDVRACARRSMGVGSGRSVVSHGGRGTSSRSHDAQAPLCCLRDKSTFRYVLPTPSPVPPLGTPLAEDLDVPSSAESSAVNLPDPPSLSAPWTHTPMSHLHPESTRSPYIGSVQSQVISYLVTLIFLSLYLALYTTSNATVVSPTDTRQRDCRRPPSIQQLRLQIAP